MAKQTARQAYEAQMVEAEEQLRKLADALAAHRARAVAEPRHWGFVGDLQHANALVREVVAFLNNEAE